MNVKDQIEEYRKRQAEKFKKQAEDDQSDEEAEEIKKEENTIEDLEYLKRKESERYDWEMGIFSF